LPKPKLEKQILFFLPTVVFGRLQDLENEIIFSSGPGCEFVFLTDRLNSSSRVARCSPTNDIIHFPKNDMENHPKWVMSIRSDLEPPQYSCQKSAELLRIAQRRSYTIRATSSRKSEHRTALLNINLHLVSPWLTAVRRSTRARRPNS